MLTTAAYPQYANNPPGISLAGRKTWDPGRTLQQPIVSVFAVTAGEQAAIVEQIGQAIYDVAAAVREAIGLPPGFSEIGKRMLLAWQEGMAMLRNKRTHDLGERDLGEAFGGLSDPEPAKPQKVVIGRSDPAATDPMD